MKQVSCVHGWSREVVANRTQNYVIPQSRNGRVSSVRCRHKRWRLWRAAATATAPTGDEERKACAKNYVLIQQNKETGQTISN